MVLGIEGKGERGRGCQGGGEEDGDASLGLIPERKRRAGGGTARRCRCPWPSVQRKKKEEKEKIFAENPLGFSVITKTFKTGILVIYLEHLKSSKNSEKIYVGFSYYRGAPCIFYFEF